MKEGAQGVSGGLKEMSAGVKEGLGGIGDVAVAALKREAAAGAAAGAGAGGDGPGLGGALKEGLGGVKKLFN